MRLIRPILQTVLLISLTFVSAVTLAGCPQPTSSTPPAALAPGYLNAQDQTLGQTLAAISSFVTNEATVNYPSLLPQMQAVEKPYLNTLIQLTNTANAMYLQYHAGTATLAQVQTAVSAAQSAQNNLTSAMGVK